MYQLGYKLAAVTKIQTNSKCLNEFSHVPEHESSRGTTVIQKAAGFFYIFCSATS